MLFIWDVSRFSNPFAAIVIHHLFHVLYFSKYLIEPWYITVFFYQINIYEQFAAGFLRLISFTVSDGSISILDFNRPVLGDKSCAKLIFHTVSVIYINWQFLINCWCNENNIVQDSKCLNFCLLYIHHKKVKIKQ